VPNLDDVRQIAGRLPGVQEGIGAQFSMTVDVKGKAKGFVWTWRERIDPKRARVLNDSVLAVSVPNLAAKEVLLASDQNVFFTEPHYNGYPAVLVRLERVALGELEDLILEAWRCKAPKSLQAELEAR